ncbi:CopK family periplasmic copper-binding protein [Roseateles saccharophilus]|uniref:Copper resistance protein K n=1 Tax=Roseateles saccharophilus TaxID=304 RepID=A0A4R3UU12_ROSSA|nr:CopK family periplasmic copper-binding protein [Roseateles saccharophilus]MBL8277973.1 CopK family periplasmic copper-binding protein [Roseateles sp.]MDG0833135.1 CopK family periplasmic copper-binding protein [Roseateles saccharophilus]TCU94602.1 copper resistance protein K [Roseateles saccharophilus]
MKSFAIALAISAAATAAAPAFAHDALETSGVVKSKVQLVDGSTLYVFKDGKMAREDRFGRAVFLKRGETLTTVDGSKIVAVGNEVARLDALLKEGHNG